MAPRSDSSHKSYFFFVILQDNDIEYTTSASAKTTSVSTRKAVYENRINEETWQCRECSTKNLTSTKRCDSCGKARYTRFTSTDESTDTVNNEQQCIYPSLTNTYQSTSQYEYPESVIKGKCLNTKYFYSII
jgi:hypothetical protein